jgi:hypothetical protein
MTMVALRLGKPASLVTAAWLSSVDSLLGALMTFSTVMDLIAAQHSG